MASRLAAAARHRVSGVASRPPRSHTAAGPGPFPCCFASQLLMDAPKTCSCQRAVQGSLGNGRGLSQLHLIANPPTIARRQGPNTHRHAKRGGCVRVFFYTSAVQSWPFKFLGFPGQGAGAPCHPLDPRPASAAYVNASFSMHRHPFELLMGVPW
jgi:hypothetical protein